ncbi:MAG TPA: GAF domain-containing protein, partial [Geobacteraceae bacterium]|nr:GAF domain-containing protein [Geobacteraceae bacterium]
MQDLTGHGRSEERLTRLNECFLAFTADPLENIRRLTSLCGEQMGGACALYNRLENGMLHTLAQWNAPPDLKLEDHPDGHLCHDVIMKGGNQLFCVQNLPETPYAGTDPNVSRYGLRTYIGMPVSLKGICVGSLCVVFQDDRSADEEDRRFIEILAIAIGVEEERRMAGEELRKAHAELEKRVEERTAELARANEQLRIDISERKKAEEALWKSETILRMVFEAIPD